MHRDLLEAYLASRYGAGYISFRINDRSAALATLLQPYHPLGAILITAWNPHSQWLDHRVNQRANDKLLADLLQRGMTVLPAFGESPDGHWREDSFLAYPVNRETSHTLGRLYRQNAVVFISSNGRSELVMTGN